MSAQRKNLVYLTGFMGSGKSTLGPILANTLGYAHIDIDQEIEKITGKKVSEIFRDLGEEEFRELEHQVLAEASKGSHCIISMGGGTIARSPNLTIAKSTGILVYLKADVKSIARRMKNKKDRPLLQKPDGEGLSEEELLIRINDILELREPFYSQADITIETVDRRVGVTVDEIVRALTGLIE